MDRSAPSLSRHAFILITALTLFALAVAGFHPDAEDGGVYIPAVKRLLNPGLYGPNPAFVLAPTRTSLFAPFVASLVRVTRIRLPWMLLALYIISTWFTLFAAWLIVACYTSSLASRTAAVALLACWLTLPIAGTSLLLVDPYVTARSFSTPLVLFALAFPLHRQTRTRLLSVIFLALAALFHPLMAGYGAAAVLCILATRLPAPRKAAAAAVALTVAALTLAVILYIIAPPETSADKEAVLTRYYWFPLSWRWYEQVGALAPLLILSNFARETRSPVSRTLSRAALLLGLISLLIALVFSRENLAAHLVARLQPLRALQLVYIVMILLLGGRIGERWLRASKPRWLLFLTLAAAPMLLAERQIYPSSDHFELPWITPRNPWQRAFLWARGNTPPDALFALDARYITQGRHEDAQGFRAIAERNALPDDSKDGGEASITPNLSSGWKQGVEAQTDLDLKIDSQRGDILKPLGVTWVILSTGSTTAWSCPYMNDVAKVCRLP